MNRTAAICTGLALALVFAAGLGLRSAGRGNPSLHPDEPVIAKWIGDVAETGRIHDRLYPTGFFKLARPLRAIARAGHAVRAAAAYRAGETDRLDAAFDDLRFTRHFSLALNALAILACFGFVYTLTGSKRAALAAAAFFAFSPIAVEHAHYATADSAMLLFLTLALFAWARAARSGRTAWLLTAAACAGFAAGVKFGLLFLLIPLFVAPFYGPAAGAPSRWRPWRLLLLSLLVFLLVFLWANPAALKPAAFFDAMARQRTGLHDEFRRSLSHYADDPAAPRAARLIWLLGHFADMGAPFLALLAAGLATALAASRFRRFWPVLFIAPTAALAAALLMAPFIRKQEFMMLLPFWAALAALPLALFPARAWRAWTARAALLLLALAALSHWRVQAGRIAAVFAWKDPRLMTRDWLAIHAPPNKTVALEISAQPAADLAFAQAVTVYKFECVNDGLAALAPFTPDYAIRNTFVTGRGFLDLFTGRPLPRHHYAWQSFITRSVPVKAWSPVTHPRLNPGHYGHAVELYAMQPPAELALDVRSLDRTPVLVSEAGRETFFAGDTTLGARLAVPLGPVPRDVGWGGPNPLNRALWVTLLGGEREAVVRLRAWGRNHRVTVAPRAVRVLALRKPRWWPAHEPYARVRAWTTARRPRDAATDCLLQLGAENAALAAYADRQYPAALQILLEQPDPAPLDLFRFAVRARDFERAAAFTSHARALAALDDTDATARAVRFNGVPGAAYDDFARIREPAFRDRDFLLESMQPRRRDNAYLRSVLDARYEQLGRQPETDAVSPFPLRTSVRLAPGRYTLELEIRPVPPPRPEPALTPENDRYVIADARGRELAAGAWSDLAAGVYTRLTLSLAVPGDTAPELFLVSPVPRTLACRNLEWCWTVRDRLAAIRQDVQACLALLPEP